MAEGKKSFVLYADLKHTVDQMSDKDAGQLLKHILSYVNDENPETKNKAVVLVFEPIKRQMKRDLVKWEEKRKGLSDRGREGGKKSGESRRSKMKLNEANASKNEANEAVTVTVTANVTATEELKKEGPVFFTLMGSTVIGKVSAHLESNHKIFLDNWRINNKDPIYETVMKIMDTDFVGHDFKDENHIRNAFKSKWKYVKENPLKQPTTKQSHLITGRPEK